MIHLLDPVHLESQGFQKNRRDHTAFGKPPILCLLGVFLRRFSRFPSRLQCSLVLLPNDLAGGWNQ